MTVAHHLLVLLTFVSVRGQGGSLKSCDSLLKRVEDNDTKLVELVILPMKTFGGAELDRLSNAIANGYNTSLRSISASGHKVPQESLRRFGSALSTQAGKLKDDEDGVSHVAIGSRDMGDVGIIAFCEGLEESDGGLIQSLDLAWKEIGEEGLCKIGAVFAKSKHLSRLDLSRNDKIGCEGVSAYCSAAIDSAGENGAPFCSLEHLILSECNIGASGVQQLAQCFSYRSIDAGKKFELNLNSNPIGAGGCESINTMLTRPSVGSIISKLQLSQCSLSDDGMTKISHAAMSNPALGLTVLDLSSNSITQIGAGAFAESLPSSWPKLVELNLAKNDIGCAGVILITERLQQRTDITSDHPVIANETVMVMKSLLKNIESTSYEQNSVLKHLDLTETNCGIEGASAALMCGGLTSLRLFNNKLGSDGFYSISKLLQGGHPSIEHLDLGGNLADEDSVVALLDAISNLTDVKVRTSTLSVLEIGGNSFGERAQAALKKLNVVWPKLDVAHDKPIKQGVTEK
eukprot:scaffold25111_cov80-Cyclotella_meneghiniana.AAC.3